MIHTSSGQSNDYSSYSALIENTSSSSSANSSSNGLAIKLGSNNIDKIITTLHFLTKIIQLKERLRE